MLSADGTTPSWGEILLPVLVAILGITCFAAGIVGQLRFRLGFWLRLASFSAAALLLAPGPAMSIAGISLPVLDVAGFIVFSMVLLLNRH